jgi:hypothetical protein
MRSDSSGRGSKTTPLLQYSKWFKWQGYQNNSATAVLKVVQVPRVPKQLYYCSIQSDSSGRGTKTTPLLQYSKLFKWQGFQNNSAAAVFKVVQVAGVPNHSAAAVFKGKASFCFTWKIGPVRILEVREMMTSSLHGAGSF